MFLGFGEIMMRIAPEGHLRFRQALPGKVDVTFAGAEANVCVSLAQFGASARFLTVIPTHAVADALVATLRGLNVDTSAIRRREAGRLGVYFVETGANQRGSTVIYDRDGSAISLAAPEEYNFTAALDGIKWLHISGITPSLSESGFGSTLALVKAAKQAGVTVSCDLNFRKKLWRWKAGLSPAALARESMTQILPFVDLLIANEEDAADVLDIHAAGTSVEQGKINAAGYEQVARTIVERFPNISRVAVTLRESVSADHNNWGGLLYDTKLGRAVLAPLDSAGNYRPYEIRDIVDRVGGGDSFAAGLIYSLTTPELSESGKALHFAVAASCLKHSILGDFNYVTKDEVLALVGGQATGRVKR